MIGRVTAVREERAQTELASAAVATATALALVDVDEFQEAGRLLIGDEVIAYTVAAGVLTLTTPLALSYDAETPVEVYPPAIERIAFVQGEGQYEEIVVRVPHSLYALIPLGIRESPKVAEAVEAVLVDGEMVVSDVLARESAIEGTFVNLSQTEVTAYFAGLDPIPSSFTSIGGTATVTPESDVVALVSFNVRTVLTNLTNYTLEGVCDATVTLDGVPVGIPEQTGIKGRFDITGPNPEFIQRLSGQTPIPLGGGASYALGIAVRATMTTGKARVGAGTQTVGFSYLLLGG